MFLGLEFWANIKLLNQRLGYFERKTIQNPNPNFVIPSIVQVKNTFEQVGLDYSKLIKNDKWTVFGKTIIGYFQYRKKMLNEQVEPNLMNAKSAKKLFRKLKRDLKPKCPLPMNKQKGAKKDFAFFTGIINMLIEANANGNPCNYDPMELTYLCRIIDMLHMGFIDEALFGKEVVNRIPILVNQWIKELKSTKVPQSV